MTVIFLFLTAIAALLVAAFCAGSETAFLSVSKGRVVHMARVGGRRAKIVKAAVFDLGRTTTTLLVGNNLAGVTYSSATAALAVATCPDSAFGQSLWSVGAALAVLFVGEFMPKLLCAARPLRRSLALAPFWVVFSRLLAPIGSAMQALISLLLPRREPKIKLTPDMVLKALADRKDGIRISDFERALIGRIIVLRSRGEFIVPDTLLTALDSET